MLFYSYSEFYDTIRVSLLYAFCCAFTSFVIGLGIASLLDKDIKCRGLFRAALLIPWAYSFYQRMLRCIWTKGRRRYVYKTRKRLRRALLYALVVALFAAAFCVLFTAMAGFALSRAGARKRPPVLPQGRRE